MKRPSSLSVLSILALILAACGGGSSPEAQTGQGTPVEGVPATGGEATAGLDTQTNDAGKVAVDVTPLSLEGDTWRFEVAFNTHSVNLAFDPAEISLLRCDQGQEFLPLAWEGSGPGGHHRSGLLIFEKPDHPVASVELVMRDVAQVSERVFRWSLPGSTGPGPSGEASDEPSLAPAPDFRLQDLEGATRTLSEFRGSPVMLFYWATW